MIQLLLLATAYAEDEKTSTTKIECNTGTFSGSDSDLMKFETCQALGLDCYPQLLIGSESNATFKCATVTTPTCENLEGYGDGTHDGDAATICQRAGAMMGLKCEYNASNNKKCTNNTALGCAAVSDIASNTSVTDSVCNLIPKCMGTDAAACGPYNATTFNEALEDEIKFKAATVSKICEIQSGILGFNLTEKAYSFQCDTGTKYKTCEDIKDPALCAEAGLFSLEMERESDDGTKTTTGDTCIRKEMIEADAEVDAADPVCEAKACDDIEYTDKSEPSSDATGVVKVPGFGTDNIETFCAALGCKVSEEDPTTKCSSASRLVVGLIAGLFVAAFI